MIFNAVIIQIKYYLLSSRDSRAFVIKYVKALLMSVVIPVTIDYV